MIRAVILAATIATIITLWTDRPPPAKVVQVDYCINDFRIARKNEFGEWEYGWGKGYGLCSQHDGFENI